MATLNINDIPDKLLIQIERLATKNNRTITEEAHREADLAEIALIQQSIDKTQNRLKFLISPETDPTWEARQKAVPQLQAEIDQYHRVNPIDFGLPDSTNLIREDRDR